MPFFYDTTEGKKREREREAGREAGEVSAYTVILSPVWFLSDGTKEQGNLKLFSSSQLAQMNKTTRVFSLAATATRDVRCLTRRVAKYHLQVSTSTSTSYLKYHSSSFLLVYESPSPKLTP